MELIAKWLSLADRQAMGQGPTGGVVLEKTTKRLEDGIVFYHSIEIPAEYKGFSPDFLSPPSREVSDRPID